MNREPAHMSVGITGGAITAMYANGATSETLKPVLQVIDVKEIKANDPAKSAAPRFRLVISDGEHYQQAILSSQLAPLVTSNELPVYALFKATEYQINSVSNRMVCIIVGLEVVNASVTEKIGN